MANDEHSMSTTQMRGLTKPISTYQSVSNGKVNWTKSCGLKMNGWDVGLNCKLGISWNTEEQKCQVYFFRGGCYS